MSETEQEFTRLKRAVDRCRNRAATARSAAVKGVYLDLATTYENVLIRIATGRWMTLG